MLKKESSGTKSLKNGQHIGFEALEHTDNTSASARAASQRPIIESNADSRAKLGQSSDRKIANSFIKASLAKELDPHSKKASQE